MRQPSESCIQLIADHVRPIQNLKRYTEVQSTHRLLGDHQIEATASAPTGDGLYDAMLVVNFVRSPSVAIASVVGY